jgi:hypothetical protein
MREVREDGREGRGGGKRELRSIQRRWGNRVETGRRRR